MHLFDVAARKKRLTAKCLGIDDTTATEPISISNSIKVNSFEEETTSQMSKNNSSIAKRYLKSSSRANRNYRRGMDIWNDFPYQMEVRTIIFIGLKHTLCVWFAQFRISTQVLLIESSALTVLGRIEELQRF